MKRKCYRCSTPVHACMSFVLAGDWLAYLKDNTVKIRELCGKCGLRELR